jgi:hypothetical protein
MSGINQERDEGLENERTADVKQFTSNEVLYSLLLLLLLLRFLFSCYSEYVPSE